jgi:CheY-like chemotaxis protein
MRAEEISSTRVFLRTKQFVRPHDELKLKCWLDTQEDPVVAVVKAHYVEKSWSGYLVDAVIEKMSSYDRRRWEEAVSRSTASHLDLSAPLRLLNRQRRPQVLWAGCSISAKLGEALREKGLCVQQTRNTAEALAQLARRPDVLVADTTSLGVDGLPLCQQVERSADVPNLLILVEYASEKEMDGYLQAGAGRVILKPCDQDTLVQRILTTVIERIELQTAAFTSCTTLPNRYQPQEGPRSQEKPRSGFWASLKGHLRSARTPRASLA